ncbi:hypothetical protein D5125_12915 [Magnetovirga frankeli]|uniref:hypothetical protein n=1 Tax=Magnetovirga frankeli TaxID=947516 RepID=UPI0012933A2B|nr:hypothetical protein D5125_12915 [gamma proteobacterium SS-5]
MNGNESADQPLEGQWLPSKSAPKRYRLTTSRGVRRELAALYARLMNDETEESKVRTGAFVLRTLLEAIRTDELEQRIIDLENRQ